MAGDSENLLDTAVLSREEMQKNAAPFNESDLIRFFNSLSETETKLREATQSRYVLEIGLVKLIEMRRVAPIEKILERLAKLENALSNGNFQTEAAVPEKTFGSPEQTAEKKTLKDDFSPEKYNFPPDEVPFAISETQNSKFTSQIIQPVSTAVAAIAATSGITRNNADVELEIIENGFADEIFENENPVIDKHETADDNQKFNPISDVFLESIAFKMPQISAEDLEHTEDNWLDAAFEAKLTREGDNLLPIKNAAKIVEPLFEKDKSQMATGKSESANGSLAAAVPAREKTTFAMPVFDSEEDSDEIPTLPENPTEEELLVYAHNHPLVKKALRIFRGKIVEIKKLENSPKNFGTK